MNKFQFLSAILLLCIGSTVTAQSFTWGYPYKITDEQDARVTYHVDDQVYKLTEYYNSKKFNRQVDVDYFNINDLEYSGSFTIEVDRAKVFGQKSDFEGLFPKDGNNYVLFSTYYDKKIKDNLLSWQSVDITTGETSDFNDFYSIKAEKMSRTADFEVAQSPNRNYYAILVEKPFEKKQSEKIEILLLDGEMNIVDQFEYTFPFPDRRGRHNELYVTDNGQVYIVKSLNLKKQKPNKNIYHWSPQSKKMTMHSLKQDDNYQIAQFQGSHKDGEFIFTGILTSDNSTFFSVSIDFSGRNSGVTATGLLSVKFDSDGNLVYNNRNDFGQVVSNLSFKDIHVQDSFYWVVMERPQVNKKSKNSNAGTTNFEYDYTYLNNGFGIASIDLTTGGLNYLNLIDTNERDTRNDNGAYLSIISLVKDGNLHLLYNETRDLRRGAVRVPFLRRFPIHDIVKPDGELIKNEALMAAGIGVKKNEQFELDTSTYFQIDNNNFLLRGKSGVEYKYGYMRL